MLFLGKTLGEKRVRDAEDRVEPALPVGCWLELLWVRLLEGALQGRAPGFREVCFAFAALVRLSDES